MVSGRKLSRSRAPCRPDRLRLLLALTSLAGTFFLAALYTVRPVRGVALTTWPLLLTLAPVVLVGLLSLTRRDPRRSLWLVLAWLTVLLGLSEEPRSLLRSVWGPAGREQAWEEARAQGRGLRVVSLNCYWGKAAEEAFSVEPDLILLQERPAPSDLRSLTEQRDGWEWLAVGDCALLVRGRLEALPVRSEDRPNLCMARVWPTSLRRPEAITVVNAHIPLPALQAKLWRRAAWHRSGEAWEKRAALMRRVAGYVTREAPRGPLLLGGDFNAPGRDPLYRLLPPTLRDAFAEAGVGWPHTWSNGRPLSRIDQIWLSPSLEPLVLRVVPSRQSDHRLVVCDLVLN